MSNQERSNAKEVVEDPDTDEISLLLASIEDKKVKNITNQLLRMSMSGEEKLGRLTRHLNGRQMERAQRIIEVCGRNFVDDLSPADREVVEYYIPLNDFKVIDEVVNRQKYSAETKMSYKIWKQQRMEQTGMETSSSTENKSETSGPSERASKRHHQDSLTILLMGETGVGKSTFVNTLINVIAYPDFDTVQKRGLHVPISATITFTDSKYESRRISHESTVGETDDEVYQDGVSCTQRPKTHIFRCGPLEARRELRIIDTPGFGDTRGDLQDKENLKNILDAVSNHREIHAIIYLLPSNNARLSKSFRYCLDEFFAHLHKSATENIFFCFTNARSTHYMPGESRRTLETYLEEARNLNISLTKKNLFAFENDAFRYLCSLEKGTPVSGSLETYKESWKNTSQEYKRLLATISRMAPHMVRDMISVNNVRKTLEILRQPLLQTTRLHCANIAKLNEKCHELKTLGEEHELLQTMLHYDVVELKTELVDRPIVVCNHPMCITMIHVYNVKERLHKAICYTETGLFRGPPEEMKECAIFQEGVCKQCGHSWEEHVRRDYKIVPTTKKGMNLGVHEKFKTVNEGKQKLEQFIKELETCKEQYEEELSVIKNAIALSTVFLTNHSIQPYKDNTDDYLGAWIEGEGEAMEFGERKYLRRFKEEYSTLVENKRQVDSLTHLENMITRLKKSPTCGQFLREVQMLEVSNEMKRQVRDEVIIDLGNDFNRDIFPG